MEIRKEQSGAQPGQVEQRDLEEINALSKGELKAEDVYVFSLRLCDNEVDRDFQRFDREALERLGGAPAGARADLAWVLPLFAFLPVQLRFWRADEEFPAQLQFFWDRSTPQLLHYETLFYAAGYLVQRIESALSEKLLRTGGPPAAERFL